jgi:hypothetical protein
MGTEHEDPLELRRDALRRIVYGADGEPPEDVAAELAAIERELTDRAGRDAASASVPRTEGEADAASASGWQEPVAERRWRLAWVLAVSIAMLAFVGAGLAVLGPAREFLSPPRGLDIFERPQTEAERAVGERVAIVGQLRPDTIGSLRSLGRAVGYGFWAYRADDTVCLLSQREYFFDWVADCSSVDDFLAAPLTRLIFPNEISDQARPRGMHPGDVVVVTWGATSTEIEWRVGAGS